MMNALRSLSKAKQPYNNVSKVITEIKLSAQKRFWPGDYRVTDEALLAETT